MIISKYLREILVCPRCCEKISFHMEQIICNSCGKVGMLSNGVLNFNPLPGSNVENTFYNDENYKKGN